MLTHGSTTRKLSIRDALLIFNLTSPCSVEGQRRTRHSEKSSHFSSTHSTPVAPHPLNRQAAAKKKLHNDDETFHIPCSFHDALEFVANGQKLLQEWIKRWGTGAGFSHRAANLYLGTGLVKAPADRAIARGELQEMVRKGMDALLLLDYAAFIDLRSIQIDEYRHLLIQTLRLIEELTERLTRAEIALRDSV
jgi:hypothetical protein